MTIKLKEFNTTWKLKNGKYIERTTLVAECPELEKLKGNILKKTLRIAIRELESE